MTNRTARTIAWLGGGLFVLSLAVCAWWFLWPLGETEPRRGWTAVAFDVALVTIFALHHSLFARDAVKQQLSRLVPDMLVRSFYVWIASALLLLMMALWARVGGTLYHTTGVLTLVHAAMQIAGVWTIKQSVSGLDALELAGIRQVIGRPPSTTAHDAGSLQIAGPYRLVRHPLYLGWMLALFGAAHMTGDRFAFAALTTTYLVIAIPWEERSLRRTFGRAYDDYTERVRWRIVPYVY